MSVTHLTPKQEKAILLKIGGMGHQDIARELGVARKTVSVWFNRNPTVIQKYEQQSAVYQKELLHEQQKTEAQQGAVLAKETAREISEKKRNAINLEKDLEDIHTIIRNGMIYFASLAALPKSTVEEILTALDSKERIEFMRMKTRAFKDAKEFAETLLRSDELIAKMQQEMKMGTITISKTIVVFND